MPIWLAKLVGIPVLTMAWVSNGNPGVPICVRPSYPVTPCIIGYTAVDLSKNLVVGHPGPGVLLYKSTSNVYHGDKYGLKINEVVDAKGTIVSSKYATVIVK